MKMRFLQYRNSTRRRCGTIVLCVTGIVVPLAPASCSAQVPSIKSGGVASASAFGTFSAIAPGSWIEIYGSNLATNTRSWAGSDFNGASAPTSLDGTRVTVGGQLAFIDYISPDQVNAQVPSNVGTGPQSIIVTTAAGSSPPYSIMVTAVEPGLLAPSSFTVSGKQYVAALFSDGSTYVLPPGAIAGLPARRAQPGDIITLYGVGFGPVAPNIPAGQVVQQSNALTGPFSLLFGQTQASVTYDGLAPNAVGLYQFNAVVPSVASNDLTPLSFALSGAAGTQTLYIAVQNGISTTQLQSVTLSPTTIVGGGSVQGMVTLSAPAPTGGAVVTLSSSSSGASVPATVTVSAESTSATFSVMTPTANSNLTVTITAAYSGSSAQATLTVTPSVSGGLLPQFSEIDIYPTVVSSVPSGVKFSSFTLLPDPFPTGVYIGVFQATTPGTPPQLPGLTFIPLWNDVTVSGQMLIFSGLQVSSSLMIDPNGNRADITSASMSVTLTPQVVSTSGTVTGSFSVTSTLGTVSGSFTGTYTASPSS